MDCFIHQSYGRLRVRLGGGPSIGPLIRTLESYPGVQKVRFNPTTRSVTVSYDPKLQSAARLLQVFQEMNLLANVISFPKAPLKLRHFPRQENLERWVGETLEEASQQLVRSLLEKALRTGGQLLLKKIFS